MENIEKSKNFTPVIGLEIHVELKTKSKMFCQCKNDGFNAQPNSNTCPVCLGMPGALPVPNKKAIDYTIMISKALNCTVNKDFIFDRKHYFYPDLPKGYQITQYKNPIGTNGYIPIETEEGKIKKCQIRRVHLEEDTGKLVHEGKETLVDLNRAGVPLVEIVTEPIFDNAEDVKRFLEELQVIIRYLGVSDADMEKGNMRLEPNISIMKPEENHLPEYKVEVKNINSFKFVKNAIEFELKRQLDILKGGDTPIQETRGYNSKKCETFSQRVKEDAADYRYFPEPDIPPFHLDEKYISNVLSGMPELPFAKVERFVKEFGIRKQDAFILTRNKLIADYIESAIEKIKSKDIKISNIEQKVVNAIINSKISTNETLDNFVLKFIKLYEEKKTDEKILNNAIQEVIKENQEVVDTYKKGKENAIMFLVGQVMKKVNGQANAQLVKDELIKKIKE